MHAAVSKPFPESLAGSRDLKLNEYIRFLEQTLLTQAPTADVHTLLGMAHMSNGDVYLAVQSLEAAIALDGDHFFAHLRYSDLLFRMGALRHAEMKARRAVSLARSISEWRLAKDQLRRIRLSVGRLAAGLRLWSSGAGAQRWPFVALLSLVATLCIRLH